MMKPLTGAEPRLTPRADIAVVVVAVAMMLGGAATLVANVIDPGIAIPIITVGIALVAIVRSNKRRH